MYVVLSLFVFAVALPVTGPAASAATGWQQAGSLTVSEISPAIANGSSDVLLRGTVTNRSADTITPVVASGLGSRPLDSTGRLQSWLSGTSDYVLSEEATTTLTPLGPGATETWSLTIPKAGIPRIGSMASLPLAVTVSDTGGPVLRTVRSTLEVVTTTAVQRSLQVTWIVPLSLPADPDLFGPTGTARTQAWQRAIGTGSTVAQLLDDLAGQPVTWLVDPRLVTEPVAQDDNLPSVSPSPTSPTSTATGTPTGTSPSGTTTAPTTAPTGESTGESTTSGTEPATSSPTTTTTTTSPPPDTGGDEVAALTTALRTRLATLSSSTQQAPAQQVWWTPIDDPDLSGLLGTAGSEATLRRAVGTDLPQDLRAISEHVVAAPATALSRSALTTLGTQWSAARRSAPVVLQPDRVVDGSGLVTTSTHRTTGVGGLVLYDESLSSALSATDGNGEGAAGAQLLAYTMALYLQGPANQRTLAAVVPRSLTISPAQLAARLTAVRSAGWVGDQTGDQTWRATASAATVTVRRDPDAGTPYPTPGDSPITHQLLARVDGERRRLTEFGTVLVDSSDDITARVAALDDALSTRWRASAGSGARMLDRASAATDGLLSRVAVSPGTVNFFADSGQLSVTVTNTLSRAVQDVQLTLTPRRAILRVDDPTHGMNLAANGRATVRFPVTALAQGEVPIDAAITTPGGLPLGTDGGQATQLQVNVRPTSSWIYWVLGILGGIVFVVGLIRAVRRGPRAAQQLDPSAPTPKDAVVTVTPSRPADDDEHHG